MHDHGFVPLLVIDCSNCGHPTVTTPLCVRPDLCYPCFGAYLAEGGQ